ncbi:DUF2345 domain-containing protein [Psychrobacter okhotskensis]|uniref:DUF2345 domain-containing protein n=1 Tax=Psychrobacter okhotskensis TaxID=212403 RepID=UPI003D073EDF
MILLKPPSGGFLNLVLSTQPQTHTQSGQHNYQQYTPTLTQTALGGQHLTERLTQLATGLGRNVKDHANIKTQLESIAKEQDTKTHQQTPYTLIDSAADSAYISDDTLIQRSMGEMISTTQQDMMISSGDSHHQVSSESLNIIADGQFSMTNAKDNITLSAHTGKLEATAKQDINIASSTKEVEIVATNKITLTAGGASIVLEGANITIAAKQFTEKAGKHSKAGGGMDGLGLAGLPQHIVKLKNSVLRKPDWVAFEENTLDLAGMKCRLTLTNGDSIDSIFDENSYVEFKDIYGEEVRIFEILFDEKTKSKNSLVDDILKLMSE